MTRTRESDDAAPRSAAVRDIICDVVAQAVGSADASGVVVLEDATPQGDLTCEWLAGALGGERVWRGASLASNVHGADAADAQLLGAWRFARERRALIAHPAVKTELLLAGALPRADLFPLGDLYASQVAALAGAWSEPAALAQLIGNAGLASVDEALARLVDAREPAVSALRDLSREAARDLLLLYERGRYYRLHARLVPKLSARTLGVDLFD